MAKYCITAANHKNPKNHVASSYLLWRYIAQQDSWFREGPTSAKEVVGLVEAGHTILTGQEDKDGISTGQPVEVVLRISTNGDEYDISKMPTF